MTASAIYVNQLQYPLREDIPEAQRLDTQHAMLYALAGGSLLFAPLRQPPTSILDVGCGNERWPIEAAIQWPGATVVGCDLREEPGIPRHLPPNYRYLKANVVNGIPLNDGSFEYSHMRALWSALTPAQWPLALRELVRLTKPGGTIEIIEGGLPVDFDLAPSLQLYCTWVRMLLSQRGVDADYPRTKLLFQAFALSPTHLTNLYFGIQPIPYGARYGALAGANEQNLLAATSNLREMIVGANITSGALFDQTIERIPQELATAEVWTPTYILYAERTDAPSPGGAPGHHPRHL